MLNILDNKFISENLPMNNYVLAKLIITRPSISVPFKIEFPAMSPAEYLQYLKETYINTGKILSPASESLSEDLLTLTLNTVWKNDSERIAYINDPVVKAYFEFIIDYRKSNGITMDWINREYSGSDNTVIREWSGSFS
jgi:hypothetical protein